MAQLEIVEVDCFFVFVPVDKVCLLGRVNAAGEIYVVAGAHKKRAKVAYLRNSLDYAQINLLAQFRLHRGHLTLVETFVKTAI